MTHDPFRSFDVTASSFDVDVVERSFEVPVLVDFWAPWCGPCRALAPVLEAVVHAHGGAVVLAKANTEEHPALAERFGIRGIPLVKLFVRGRAVAEFTGAQPKGAIETFLREHLPDPIRDLLTEVQGLAERGAWDEAAARLPELLDLGAERPGVRLVAARIELARGQGAAARTHLDGIDEADDEFEAAQHLRAAVEFAQRCAAAGGEQALRDRLGQAPKDLDAQVALGECLVAQGHYEAALNQFLEVIKAMSRPLNSPAHRAMLTVFGLIGRHHELSDHFKRQLQIYL